MLTHSQIVPTETCVLPHTHTDTQTRTRTHTVSGFLQGICEGVLNPAGFEEWVGVRVAKRGLRARLLFIRLVTRAQQID